MLNELLFSRIDSRPLGLTRIIVGAAAFIRAAIAWPILNGLLEPGVLDLPYADWIPGPSRSLVAAIIAVWVTSAIGLMIGWRVPVTGSLLFASIVSSMALDQQAYSNHLYLMAWLVLLLVIADAGAGLNTSRSDRKVIRWPILLLKLQLTIVYGFSALTKLNSAFLSGGVLGGTLGTGILPFPDTLRTSTLMATLSALAVLVELFVAIFIWRPRFRPAAFVFGFGLHLAITLLLFGTDQLLVFSLEMLALYPLFLERDRVVVAWDNACRVCSQKVEALLRLDVLRRIDTFAGPAKGPVFTLRVRQGDRAYEDFAGLTLMLENVVPTLWFAPVLRLPGVRQLGDKWFESRVRQNQRIESGRGE